MRYEVIDTQATVASDLRSKSTSVNPRYQIRNVKTGAIVDEFSTKASATADCRALNREAKNAAARKLAAIKLAEKNLAKAHELADAAHAAITSAFGAYELDEGLRMETARASDETLRLVRGFAPRAAYMRGKIADG